MLLLILILLVPNCISSRRYDSSKHNRWLNDIIERFKDDLERRDHWSDNESSHKRSSHHKFGYLKSLSLRMPNVAPSNPDTYLCFAKELPDNDRYIVEYEPKATMDIAHHMLVYGCKVPFLENKVWNCQESPLCANGESPNVVYAWGKNAPKLTLPKDVGFHVGGRTNYKYLVLQIHYLHVDAFKDGKHKDHSGVEMKLSDRIMPKLAGIYEIGGAKTIPAQRKVFNVDGGCEYESGPDLHVFGYRVHAHKLGVVITGYRVRNKKWTVIGQETPQKPQAFYKSNDVTIKPGDTLMVRCTYDSTSRSRPTYFGATHTDEMCNFYMMYSYQPRFKGNVGPSADYCPQSFDPQLLHQYPN